MNKYHDRINKVEELGTIPKQLTQTAIDKLSERIAEHIRRTGDNNLDTVLPFIITYVYNQAYLAAIQDSLSILRER